MKPPQEFQRYLQLRPEAMDIDMIKPVSAAYVIMLDLLAH